MMIASYSTNGRRKIRVLFLTLLLAASTATSSAQSDPRPTAKFNIQVAGEIVQVERWGNGPVEAVIFSHSGDLASELRTLNKALSTGSRTYFERALGKNYFLFIWTYPDTLIAKASDVIGSSFGPGPVLPSPSYRGLGLGVVQQIRKATGLKKICLVGNSLGAGILLWDAAELSKDKHVSLVLVAPTPLFLPPTRPSPGMFKRTIVVV